MADTTFVNATTTVPGTLVEASWLNDVNTSTYSVLDTVVGTNAITANGPSTVSGSYPNGAAFRFLPAANNTGAVTINVNGIGVVSVTKYGTTPLVAGDLVVGSWAYVTYDGTRFQLVNPQIVDVAHGGTGATTASQALINLGATGRLIGTQTFTASGTYTPTAGTTRIIVKGQGSGGAGGGSPASGAGQVAAGGGGGAGGIGETLITSGFSGATVTIGAGGTGVSGAGGGAGATCTFGTFLSLLGGAGGGSSGPSAVIAATGGIGGTSSLGTIYNTSGQSGDNTGNSFASGISHGAHGADSLYGGGGRAFTLGGAGSTPGEAATGRGAGGGGSAAFAVGGAQAGGAGTAGIFVVYEYS